MISRKKHNTSFNQLLYERNMREPILQMARESGKLAKQITSEQLEQDQEWWLWWKYFAKLINGHVGLLRNLIVEDLYRNCRKIWESQGEVVTSQFICGEVLPRIDRLIIEHQHVIEETIRRPRAGVTAKDLELALGHLKGRYGELRNYLWNRYEIEAAELAMRESRSEAAISASAKESKGTLAKAALPDRRAVIAAKIQRTPDGTITTEEAAIFFGVVPKTIRAWINGEVPTKALTRGVRGGTVTNASIVRLEKNLQLAPEE